MISYEDFKKIDLRVAKVIESERIENSDKLLKLIVELGEEKRQIIAGIGKSYEPQELLGKSIVIIANLEPRNLMGYESQGMVLAADGGMPIVIVPDKVVESGSIIK